MEISVLWSAACLFHTKLTFLPELPCHGISEGSERERSGGGVGGRERERERERERKRERELSLIHI